MSGEHIFVLGCDGEEEETGKEIGILNDPELGSVLLLPVVPPGKASGKEGKQE